MRASIKLLLWLFAGISALLAVLVALLFFVDVNLYRTQIKGHVSTAFGREVVFAGPLSLEPSLTPRFAVKGVKITNPDWASRPFLATVDKFDIRVSLLPLLRGDLEIISLEFHGVDLLLEEAADGANNFTFGASGEPVVLPAIEHMSLYEASIAYATAAGPVRRLHMEQVTARKVPGEAVQLEARTTLNSLPVTVSLRGEPPNRSRPHDPWQLTLLGEAGDLSLRVEGSLADPGDWLRGDYRLVLQGRRLDDLETLSGYKLPEAGPYELDMNIRFRPDESLTVSDLTARIGGSDIEGNFHWDMTAPRPVIKVGLDSQRLDSADMGLDAPPTGNAYAANTAYWDQTVELGTLSAIDFDIELRVQRLDGLAKPLQDLVLSAHAERQNLRLETVKATLDGTQIVASASLPWGERLTSLAPENINLKTLLTHAELDLRAQATDAAYRYATKLLGRPLDLTVSSVEASAGPDSALTIRADATLNDQPLTLQLQGEPLAALLQRPTGPWQTLTLAAQGPDIRLDASGSVARPFEAAGFDVSYALRGAELDALLPLQGAFSLTGHYADKPDHQLFDQLKVTLGRSDIGGRILIYQDEQRPRLVANLDAGRIDLDGILPDNGGTTMDASMWEQPLAIGGLGAVDLDVEVRVQRLDGLAKPVRDIRLGVQADRQTLSLAPLVSTVDGTHFDAQLQLPWGERLAALGKAAVSVRRLAQQADLVLKAQPPDGKLRYQTRVLGHPVDLGLGVFEASVRPGEKLRVGANATVDNKPLRVNLRAEPLAHLLQRPTGPWRDLALEVRGEAIRLQATGSVEQPLQNRGFDIDYRLQGDKIEALLPLFDLILPLEGPYSLTGHFADLPDRAVFDALKIAFGDSDIGGRISLYQGQQRQRIVAQLNSEQLYLSKLLPVSEAYATPAAPRRVIPDYKLPIESMRTVDGELEFKGKRLRTSAGDLGDISFRATLQDGVLTIDPFRVRGWAGARIESDVTIDAAQNPPVIALNWIARQLSYGVLLEQAGFAETVEGDMDISLRLSGKGRSRYEFLGDADGQLVIVGKDGRFGSRRLDLWAADLVTTMLPWEWGREDVTDLNCLVARISIDGGVASSDELLVDSRRITIAAAGTLDLASEELDLVFAPRPKRSSLVSLSSPVHVTGTLAAPEVAVTVLPRNRMAAAGTGALAGLINPGYLIFTFTQAGSGQANPCAAAVERAMVMKGRQDKTGGLPTAAPPRFSLLPGCTRSRQRPAQ